MTITRTRARAQGVILALVLAALTAFAAAGTAHAAPAPRAYAQQCTDSQWPSVRSSTNPLQLTTPPPASNPLTGALFFVPGPLHGMAAGAIASTLGLDPSSFPASMSFADFWSYIFSNPQTSAQLQNSATHATVTALAKIASEPETQRLSMYSGGGGPGAIYGQTQKILCHNLTADPGSVPVLQTFFVYPNGQYCPSPGALKGNQGTFERQVTEFAQGIGRHPAVVLAELDSIGSAACMNVPKGTGRTTYDKHGRAKFTAYPPQGAELTLWANDIAYEIYQLERYAPNTVIYTEGGYSDGNSPKWTASMLRLVINGLKKLGGNTNALRGFYTNDTHEAWTANEISWAYQVSNRLARLTGYRAYYVVNTSENGRGPDVPNGSVVKSGNEILCNPPGRGLGPMVNTSPAAGLGGIPGAKYLDAFLWVHAPGRSSGSCNGGPPPGVFWPQRAVQLAQNANGQLGPGSPSRPY